MKNEMLNYSFDQLAQLLEENLILLQFSASPNLIQDEMIAHRAELVAGLTNKQYHLWMNSDKSVAQVTKSKKLLDIHSKWQNAQKELQFVLNVQKQIDDIEYTIKQKHTMSRPALIHSTAPTMYDIMLRRIAKHGISSAQSAQQRTKQMTKNALRLCK